MHPQKRLYSQKSTNPIWIIGLWLIISQILYTFGYAQTTSVVPQADSVISIEKNVSAADTLKIKSSANRFNPQKSLLYAAVFPGAGQLYNKKYWKIPIVYGGFAFLGYYIDFYNQNYKTYRSELFELLNTGTNVTVSTSGLSETQLRNTINRYRRERDFFIILTGLWYILQITDAHVDSHLKEFDLNPNLQVRIEPSFTQDAHTGRNTGFSILIRF